MFLHRMAAGLVFAAGAGVSRLAVTGESFLLMAVGLAAAIAGISWFASGSPLTSQAETRPDRRPW